LWNFGIELEGLGSYGFDLLSHETVVGDYILTRALWGALAYPVWKRVQYNFYVTNHEFGHGMRLSARGGNPDYRWTDGSDQVTENIFIFFLRGFTKYGLGASSAGTGSGDYFYPSSFNAVRAGAGVNNSSLYAEALEDNLVLGGGHPLEYQAYAYAKTDTSRYVDTNENNLEAETGVLADMEAMKIYYESQGFDISFGKMKSGSQISRWASSTQLAYAIGAFRYVFSANPVVTPLVLGGVKIPDFSHFLTSEGLSYKVRSGLLLDETWIPVNVEYVYEGRNSLEINAGYYSLFEIGKNRKGMRGAEFFLHSSAKFGLKARFDFNPSEQIVASLGASLFQDGTLAGEREMAKYTKSGAIGYDLWLRLSAFY
jgi:hypothetical protein